jgi:hypothetical protein
MISIFETDVIPNDGFLLSVYSLTTNAQEQT